MKRLQIILIIFALLLSVPLAWLFARTYEGLAREERSQLDFFAETILDQMEIDLSELVRREEARSADEYSGDRNLSGPLSGQPGENFIVGYFQNDPDGTFQSPVMNGKNNLAMANEQLREINGILNLKRAAAPLRPEPMTIMTAKQAAVRQKKKESSFAERYLSSSNLSRQRAASSQEEKRVEEITMAQASKIASRKPDRKDMAYDLASNESDRIMADKAPAEVAAPAAEGMAASGRSADYFAGPAKSSLGEMMDAVKGQEARAEAEILSPAVTFQVEVSPLQSLMIDEEQVLIFRSILLQGESYRQCFVISIPALFEHLADTYFRNEPMAKFTGLRLSVTGKTSGSILTAGINTTNPVYDLTRTFPRPFSFVSAALTCDHVPASSGRQTLLIMSLGLAVIMLLGFLAIYKSARVIVDLSERKTGFVSSVTHELKTPLTNIRLYTEMLEQGMAKSRKQEQEYFRIVGSESSRLMRLINNVLEFAKLERRQRTMNMQHGTLDEVVSEIKDIFSDRLRSEDFRLKVEISRELKPFPYDREVMVQIIGNLIENSIKFGSRSPLRVITLQVERDKGRVLVKVADTGPGIPEQSRKKVFDDFYRVENALTRQTKGTGIGLALVRKFAAAMGGKVAITNNPGAGCTVTVSLPDK